MRQTIRVTALAMLVGLAGPTMGVDAAPRATARPKAKAAKAEPLDGHRFVGEMGATGVKIGKGKPEDIFFQDGQLHSKAASAMGFGMAGYSLSEDGSARIFHAAMAGSGEELLWTGGVQNKVLNASVTRKRGGKVIERYWVQAKQMKTLKKTTKTLSSPDAGESSSP